MLKLQYSVKPIRDSAQRKGTTAPKTPKSNGCCYVYNFKLLVIKLYWRNKQLCCRTEIL